MAASGGVLVVVLASLLAHTNIGKKYQKTCHPFKRNVGLYLLTSKEPLHTKRSQTSLKVSNLSMTLDAVRVLSFFFPIQNAQTWALQKVITFQPQTVYFLVVF